MDLSGYNWIGPTLGGITAVATAWYSVQEVLKEYRRRRNSVSNEVLEKAKEYDAEIKRELKARIDLLEVDVHNLKESIQKDISNIKDNHALELKNLSEKIGAIRDQLNDQHSQLMSILVKMIDKNS